MCACQTGYFGPDCSYKMCPKGDDPLTPSTGYKSIRIDITTTKTASGNFRFAYYGQSFLIPAQIQAYGNEDCVHGFTSMQNIEQVSCNVTRHSTYSATYFVQFISFPLHPYEDNLYFHTGNPSMALLGCDPSAVTDRRVSCHLVDMTPSNVTIPGTTHHLYTFIPIYIFILTYFNIYISLSPIYLLTYIFISPKYIYLSYTYISLLYTYFPKYIPVYLFPQILCMCVHHLYLYIIINRICLLFQPWQMQPRHGYLYLFI